MAGFIGKLVFNRILKESRENKQGREDPYFEQVPTKKLSTFSGNPRMKKRKKALPPGLSEEDQETLVKVKRRAYRLDMALGTFLGFKVGWGSVIGLLPVAGDVIDGFLALMVIRTASEANIPSSLKIHMLLNVVFDFVIGLIPFLGDLADMAYKANTRNAILLEDYLRQRGRENQRLSGMPLQPDPSLGDVDVDTETGTVYSAQPVSPPQPTYYGSSAAGPPRGWSGREREYDVEAQRGAPRGADRDRRSKSTRSHGGSRRERDGSRHGSSRREGRNNQRSRNQETGTL